MGVKWEPAKAVLRDSLRFARSLRSGRRAAWRGKACWGSGMLGGNVQGTVLWLCLTCRFLEYHALIRIFQIYLYFPNISIKTIPGTIRSALALPALLPTWRECVWWLAGRIGLAAFTSWHRGYRGGNREGTGFTNPWGYFFFPQAAGFVDCILGDLLVI